MNIDKISSEDMPTIRAALRMAGEHARSDQVAESFFKLYVQLEGSYTIEILRKSRRTMQGVING